MSFTVVIKDNETSKILFASKKTNALVIGVVAELDSTSNPAIALAASCAGAPAMAMAIGLAREAIEHAEEANPKLKILARAADHYLAKRDKNGTD